jgi:hypothetical protein
MSVAVLRHARYTRHERTVRTSEDQYPSIRAWCISLVVITTVVMWIWPFEYFTYVWHVLHIKNSDVLLINLVLALVRPAVSLITAVALLARTPDAPAYRRVSENVPPFAFSAAAAAAGFYLAFGSHDGGSLSGTVGARLILAEPQLQVYLTVSFDDALPHVICFERK